MKKRTLALTLTAVMLVSSCAGEQGAGGEAVFASTTTAAATSATETTTTVSATTTVSTTTTAKTTAAAAEITTTTAETTATVSETTTAQTAETTTVTEKTDTIPEVFEPVRLARTEEVGYGDFLQYREVFDDIEDIENPRGSCQYINIGDEIYNFTGRVSSESSGVSITEDCKHMPEFLAAFEGEPSHKELYSLEFLGTGISTLDVFSLEDFSATKEWFPAYRLSENFVVSISDYYSGTQREKCSFSVWQKSEQMTEYCRIVKLLWKKRNVYAIDNVTLIWLAFKDNPFYLEINAPKEYHGTIENYLLANNVKGGYKFRTAYTPEEKLLSEYSDRILREDYAKYISTEDKQYTPEDVYVLNYGGTYNGNEVVIMDLCTNSMYDYTSLYLVEDFWLEAPGDCRILLHKDGSFMDIEETYVTGNLTAEELGLIEHALPKLHTNPKPVPVPAPAIPLSDEAELQLRRDYAYLTREDSPDNVEVIKYFGTYDGKEVVIMYKKDAVVTDDMSYTSVNGYLIAVGSGCYEITVHHYGYFYPLQYAYNSGYITEEDLQAIVYYSQNPMIYEE